jgi:DNA mismatch endonuclease, patch repair protein
MADVFSPKKRSQIMARVRGRGNKSTELTFVQLLRGSGIQGWRRHKNVFGRPDFIFPKLKLAVFIDGCFWHGCPAHASSPMTNSVFWKRKLEANRKRDKTVTRTLRNRGWRVMRIWQHSLLKKNQRACLMRLSKVLEKDGWVPPRFHGHVS